MAGVRQLLDSKKKKEKEISQVIVISANHLVSRLVLFHKLF